MYAEMLKEAVEKDDRNNSARDSMKYYLKRSHERYMKEKKEQKRMKR